MSVRKNIKLYLTFTFLISQFLICHSFSDELDYQRELEIFTPHPMQYKQIIEDEVVIDQLLESESDSSVFVNKIPKEEGSFQQTGSYVRFCTERDCEFSVTLDTQTHSSNMMCEVYNGFNNVPAGTYYYGIVGYCDPPYLKEGVITVDGSSSYVITTCPTSSSQDCCPSGCLSGGSFKCSQCKTTTTSTTTPTSTTTTPTSTTTEPTSTTTTTIPIVDFTGTPTSGVVPLTVEFKDNTIGTIERYLWDFGDGNFSLEKNPTHQYLSEGTFTVTLSVTSSDNVSHRIAKPNYVTVKAACPFMNVLGEDRGNIKLLRNFRDALLKNIWGFILTSLYYQHAEEITGIMIENHRLNNDLRHLIRNNIHNIVQLIAVGQITLSEDRVKETVMFLNELKMEGNDSLREDLELLTEAIEDGYLLDGLGVELEE